jgi:hypothetical protein
LLRCSAATTLSLKGDALYRFVHLHVSALQLSSSSAATTLIEGCCALAALTGHADVRLVYTAEPHLLLPQHVSNCLVALVHPELCNDPGGVVLF